MTKSKIIIVEGVDLSGKSTLVEAISKKFPGMVVKITDKPKDNSEKEQTKQKFNYNAVLTILTNNPDRNFVLDRYYPSELVYSLPMRGYEAFDDDDYDDFELIFSELKKERDVFLIYCNPGLSVLKERYKQRGDDFIKESHLEELVKRYQRFVDNTSLEVLQINTTEKVEDMVKQVEKFINTINF